MQIFYIIATVVLTIGSAAGANDTVQIAVERDGRKIMHDGFLMEWSPATASVWGRDTSRRYDAVATPEGLAGYLNVRLSSECSEEALVFIADGTRPVSLALTPELQVTEAALKVDRSSLEQDSTCTIEWLFPWPEGYNATAEPFSLTIADRCGDAELLPVLHFVYRYRNKKSGQTGGLIGRVVLIGALGALYLMVQAKIRNQSRKKESPHQSA
jgi:hypothetical protein